MLCCASANRGRCRRAWCAARTECAIRQHPESRCAEKESTASKLTWMTLGGCAKTKPPSAAAATEFAWRFYGVTHYAEAERRGLKTTHRHLAAHRLNRGADAAVTITASNGNRGLPVVLWKCSPAFAGHFLGLPHEGCVPHRRSILSQLFQDDSPRYLHGGFIPPCSRQFTPFGSPLCSKSEFWSGCQSGNRSLASTLLQNIGSLAA